MTKGTIRSLSAHSCLVGLSMNVMSLSCEFSNCFLFKLWIGSGLLGSFYEMPLGSHGRGVIKVSHQTTTPSQNWNKKTDQWIYQKIKCSLLKRFCWTVHPQGTNLGGLLNAKFSYDFKHWKTDLCSLLLLCAWCRCVWTFSRNKYVKCDTLTNSMF